MLLPAAGGSLVFLNDPDLSILNAPIFNGRDLMQAPTKARGRSLAEDLHSDLLRSPYAKTSRPRNAARVQRVAKTHRIAKIPTDARIPGGSSLQGRTHPRGAHQCVQQMDHSCN